MTDIPSRLTALREQMRAHGIHAYLVPSTDAHHSEYVPSCWQRRPWISGFTGSAGDVVVTLESAGLWTDGRYYQQAATQLEGSGIILFKSGQPDVPKMVSWLLEQLNSGERLGVDPRVLGIKAAESLGSELDRGEIELTFIPDNLVDVIWEDRPSPSTAPVMVMPERHAGESVESKLGRLRKQMAEAKVDTHVITAMDAIAWLCNLRGSDVDFNPVFISYAAVSVSDAYLFVDEAKLDDAVVASLSGLVKIRPYADIEPFLTSETAGKVWLDEESANHWIAGLVGERAVSVERSPVVEFKAIKNRTEMSGIRLAHIIDGVAMVRFLKWMEEVVGREPVSELSAAGKLLAFREEGEGFVGPSFPTISAYGPHGAIAHYSVDEKSDIPIETNSLYLVDSGGQYTFGTTDITRTVCYGEGTDEQKEMFTRVLKGHIDLTTLSFPDGTTGQHIDVAARRPLWEAGRNFHHGTGHGIGHYLNVHEGPISISGRAAAVKLAEGHVISNEPGYYREGAFGIRIENLVTVVADEDRSSDQAFYKFETLTRCPIESALIVPEVLGEDGVTWLNDFHRVVRESLQDQLDPDTANWLENKTQPI